MNLVFKIDFKSARNRAYSQVAIAPTTTYGPCLNLLNCLDLAPGMGLGILNAGLGMALVCWCLCSN